MCIKPAISLLYVYILWEGSIHVYIHIVGGKYTCTYNIHVYTVGSALNIKGGSLLVQPLNSTFTEGLMQALWIVC